jgi:hypothetical protein
MAKLLNCQDMDFDCDYICAETEAELFSWAHQYVKGDQRSSQIPGEFEERVRTASQEVAHC